MNSLRRTSIVYAGLALFSLIVALVYPVFGHGVYSVYLFVACPVLGIPGMLFYWLLKPWVIDKKGYKLFHNTYNFGIATIVCGLLVKGVIEIANGASDIVQWFFYIGALVTAGGAGILVSIVLRGSE